MSPEGKQTVKMTRLSCHRFRSNEVRLWLSVLAYNLGPPQVSVGAVEEDQELVVDQLAAMVGEDRGRLVKHARYWLMLAESYLTRRLFGSMVRRIDALAVATG
jgi:hypothetical protein